MVSVSGAKQVINLFVRNQGERLITRPKTVQMFAEDLSKLRYAPQLEGDIMTLSPQAKKVVERIADLKSRGLDFNGEKLTYKEFFLSKNFASFSEDRKLSEWYKLLQYNQMPQNQIKCLEEINKCFQIENMSKIEFFKNLTKEEKELLQQFNEKSQLIPVITGHKPAYYGHIEDGVVNFQNAIKNTKYADNFIAINRKENPKAFTIVNKTRLKEIIENNKEIYCRELGLDINTPTKEVYNKWLYCLEHECPTEEKPFAFGLMLGYPKWSSLIYSLERRNFMEDNNELLKFLREEYIINNQKTQEIIMKAIRHENSPLKNYSEEFKRDFEHYVRTEDFRKFMRPDGGDFYYQCSIYGSESAHMEKVLKEEADFINNFRMEQLFS